MEVALVVDDSSAVRRRAAEVLREQGLFERVDEAGDGAEALARLAQPPPVDLVLCDAVMPTLDGLGFVEAVRARPEWADLPIIIMSGLDDPVDTARLLDAGANDFVRKPFDPRVLVARVRVQLKLRALQMELRLTNERLEALATTDSLTGLLNRRAFLERVEQEWDRASRYGRPLAFVMVDLDRFKAINDTYGHQIGDAVLRTAATRLARGVRASSDLVGRYGGEEFALFLPETTLAGALLAAERFRGIIAAAPFPVGEGIPPIAVTASFGVSAAPHPKIASVADLIAAADRALYRAKAAGRNRVVAE
ncbi:MAG TPA: diguanylate cyclase [Thermodesulfobacteriota bacterium]|nr:diguanylate cyclase [Thermodesulfobacteriota bacterium]